jgi:DNA-binding NarL/FixJ family response regulator
MRLPVAKISVLLADDHLIVRQGMRALLNAQPDMEVCGEASDGYELLELIGKLSPQVVITDIAMPNLNGIEATRQIQRRYPQTRIIILSMHSAMTYVVKTLQSGALGYLLKNDSFDEVIAAVRAVMQGQRYLSSQIPQPVLDAFLAAGESSQDPQKALTGREREILQWIAEGHTSAQIAEKLNISVRTVEKHRANLKAKLGLTSQAEIVHFAIQQGIVTLKE